MSHYQRNTNGWSPGNEKLGPIPNWSILPIVNCPGSSERCRDICYAAKFARWPTVKSLWESNQNRHIGELPEGTTVARIHVSGDFHSATYIQEWILFVQAHPQVRFWTYTRSWAVPALLPALEELRAQPNVQLFASVDTSMPDPPAGWRTAYLDDDPRATGLHCLEQVGKVRDCNTCKYCIRPLPGNVIFKEH